MNPDPSHWEMNERYDMKKAQQVTALLSIFGQDRKGWMDFPTGQEWIYFLFCFAQHIFFIPFVQLYWLAGNKVAVPFIDMIYMYSLFAWIMEFYILSFSCLLGIIGG